ncbi:MAG: hypothetical protein ACT4QG_16285 [Sporichthyaceae bacterium]
MTSEFPSSPAAPEAGSRPSGAPAGAGRNPGDAADVALSFRAVGPACDESWSGPADAASGQYEFHAQSWFEGPDNGVGGLVAAARSGSWDPLVDPLPVVESAVAHSDGTCAPAPQAAVVQVTAARTGGRAGEGWARGVLAATAPMDLESWFRPVDGCAATTQPVDLSALFRAEDEERYTDHPSGPLPQAGVWPPTSEVPDSPAELTIPSICEAFDATLAGALGLAELGFRGGVWYSITDHSSRPVTVAEAMRTHPQLAGQITQLVCWWMRQHPMSDRSLDLATELAIAVSASARS